jgi:hypothetical protein
MQSNSCYVAMPDDGGDDDNKAITQYKSSLLLTTRMKSRAVLVSLLLLTTSCHEQLLGEPILKPGLKPKATKERSVEEQRRNNNRKRHFVYLTFAVDVDVYDCEHNNNSGMPEISPATPSLQQQPLCFDKMPMVKSRGKTVGGELWLRRVLQTRTDTTLDRYLLKNVSMMAIIACRPLAPAEIGSSSSNK